VRLDWDGCLNVRDLGGHPTEHGGETRFGAIVRADSVRQLSDEGWAALVAYGVRTIVDLRRKHELDADPPAELPVDVVHVPLIDPVGPEVDAEIEAVAEAAPDALSARRAIYLEVLERFEPSFAQAVAAVASAPEGCVLVHCKGGTDRTGLVSALLLRLAGVPVEEVGADFALSGPNRAAVFDPWIAEAPDDEERELRRVWASTPAEVMTGVVWELERRHGSVEAYLRGAGVAERDLERARKRLLS
jgi:protein tyrosine/serine phosphatase